MGEHYETATSTTSDLKVGLISVLWIAAVFCIASSIEGKTDPGTAQVAFFLDRGAATDNTVRIPILTANLNSPSGVRSVPLRRSDLSTETTRSDQELLSIFQVPPGVYSSLTFEFGNATVVRAGEEVILEPVPSWLSFDVGLRLSAGAAALVLLTWTPQTGEIEDSTYEIRIQRAEPNLPPIGSRAFVSCSESDNISVLDRFTHRVVDILPGGRSPKGMAHARSRQQLFVAASGEDRILVYEIAQRKLLTQITLSAGDEPTRLLINSADDELYVLNRGSNSISVIDLTSFQETDRQVVGVSPTALALDPLTGRVYIASDVAQEIAVYDPVMQSIAMTYALSGVPTELVMNTLGRLLYTAIESRRVLLVLDGETGDERAVLTLCSQAAGLAQNESTRQIYAALARCGEIGIFRAEDELNLGRIRLRHEPGLIALDPENRRLFVTMPKADRVAIINVNSKRTEGEIEVGDHPYQLIIPN